MCSEWTSSFRLYLQRSELYFAIMVSRVTTRINRYQVLSMSGTDGMSETFRTRWPDCSSLER